MPLSYTFSDHRSRCTPGIFCLWNYNKENTIVKLKIESNLPVPRKMFPHDRHHVLHHTSGRPQLVQRAVLVVDPLQENLESWYWEKSCTIKGTGWCVLDKMIFWKLSRRRTTPCPLCSSALSPAWAKKDGDYYVCSNWKGIFATILENCKRWFQPLPLLPPLPCLFQDAHNLPWCSFPSPPRFKLQ